MNVNETRHKAILQRVARTAMMERGLLPAFSDEATAEAARMQAPRMATGGGARDLRALPWVSIDNDDSLDLDQLTAARTEADGSTTVLVAVADVASLVGQDSALEEHAHHNTTSVYTAAEKFPMFPDRLSTDLTSLNPHEDRPAMVV